MLHTYSFTYHPRYIMFLSQYFSFPLSVPFHQCSIPIHSPTTHTILCFSPSTSVFPCQYHSTNAPYPFIHLPPTLYNVSLPVLQFSPVSTIPPLLHTHIHLHVAFYGKDKRVKPGNLPKRDALSDLGEQRAGTCLHLALKVLTYVLLTYLPILKRWSLLVHPRNCISVLSRCVRLRQQCSYYSLVGRGEG